MVHRRVGPLGRRASPAFAQPEVSADVHTELPGLGSVRIRGRGAAEQLMASTGAGPVVGVTKPGIEHDVADPAQNSSGRSPAAPRPGSAMRGPGCVLCGPAIAR